jgi:diacylglycerol kinase (ATP)
MDAPRRYLVILNAFAGRCGTLVDLEERLRKALAPARVVVLRTESIEEAQQEARAARRGSYDAVIAVGGDGTHHNLIDTLALGDTPLGLIPLGTANDLAAEFDIPKDLEAACRIVREGFQTRVDIIKANDKMFATAGGMGLCTDIALGVCEARRRSRLFHAFMRLVGGHIYSIYMLFTVLFAWRLGYRYRFELDGGEVREVDAYLAMVMNQAFLGQNFQAIPDAKNKDGTLDVLLIKKIPGWFERLRLLRTMTLSLKGQHIGRPDVEVLRSSRVKVTSPTPVPFFADGELVGRAETFEFQVLNRALPLLVPSAKSTLRVPLRRVRTALTFASGTGSGIISGGGRVELSLKRSGVIKDPKDAA